MHSREPYLRRRTLLVGAACGAGLLAIGGCREGTDERRPTGPDPLEPVLATAVWLADRYRQAMTAVPDLAGRLTPLRDAHQAHVLALTRELGTVDRTPLPSGMPPVVPAPTGGSARPGASGSGAGGTGSAGAGSAAAGSAGAAPTAASVGPLPRDRAGVLADLRSHEGVASRQAAAVCLAGPGYRAGLLGSIAAARASHVEALA